MRWHDDVCGKSTSREIGMMARVMPEPEESASE
jgi:hypothetical protein